MNKKLLHLMVAVLLIGCTPSDNLGDQKTINPPDIGVPVTPNGEVIDIIAPEGWNSFKVGKPVFLLVNNLSNEQIIFEYNLGAKVYILQENGWLETENNIVYPDTNKIILEPNKTFDVFKNYTLMLLPDVSNFTDIASLRIFVVGNVYKDGQTEDQQVATYIDLQLNP